MVSGLWLPYKKPHFLNQKTYYMPVIKITKELNLIHNEERFFIRVDGKFISGFDTFEKAEQVALQLAKNEGREKTDEITIKEIIC